MRDTYRSTNFAAIVFLYILSFSPNVDNHLQCPLALYPLYLSAYTPSSIQLGTYLWSFPLLAKGTNAGVFQNFFFH